MVIQEPIIIVFQRIDLLKAKNFTPLFSVLNFIDFKIHLLIKTIKKVLLEPMVKLRTSAVRECALEVANPPMLQHLKRLNYSR